MRIYTEEELGQIFDNRSNCYAEGIDVVMAMDKERFIEVVKELNIFPTNESKECKVFSPDKSTSSATKCICGKEKYLHI